LHEQRKIKVAQLGSENELAIVAFGSVDIRSHEFGKRAANSSAQRRIFEQRQHEAK